jgi:hypothetical protein
MEWTPATDAWHADLPMGECLKIAGRANYV